MSAWAGPWVRVAGVGVRREGAPAIRAPQPGVQPESCGPGEAGRRLLLLKAAFVQQPRAPVSLTLEPAAYLSNSKGNSAAVERKKITSAAEREERGPRLGPGTLLPPGPAQRRAKDQARAGLRKPSLQPGAPAGPDGAPWLACLHPGPGTPALSEAAAEPRASLWLTASPQKKSPASWASGPPAGAPSQPAPARGWGRRWRAAGGTAAGSSGDTCQPGHRGSQGPWL